MVGGGGAYDDSNGPRNEARLPLDSDTSSSDSDLPFTISKDAKLKY